MRPITSIHLLLVSLALPGHSCFADNIDEYVERERSDRRIPGVALKIIQDGKPIKTATYGLAHLEWNIAVTPETVFEIGSVTKQFTAAAILLLAQEGKLTIDDPLHRHLNATPTAWSNITIRHLLTHTSGIKSYTGLQGFELTKRLSQAEFIKNIGAQPLEFPPGQSWKYCNSGYNLLGHIIENVSGKKYLEFLQAHFFQPLGMTRTTVRDPGVIVTNRAAGYEQKSRLHINRDYDLTDVFAAGALVSTIGDLEKWNAGLDGEHLLNKQSKTQMWTPAKLTSGTATKYGLGWYIDLVDGHQNIGHGGSTSGFSATLQRFPEDKLAVILLSNTDEQVATRMAKAIAQMHFQSTRQTSR